MIVDVSFRTALAPAAAAKIRVADGQQYAISIPSAIAADLVPVLESVAASQPQFGAGEMTRLPKTCAVGHAKGDRMLLLRFDDEAPE